LLNICQAQGFTGAQKSHVQFQGCANMLFHTGILCGLGNMQTLSAHTLKTVIRKLFENDVLQSIAHLHVFIPPEIAANQTWRFVFITELLSHSYTFTRYKRQSTASALTEFTFYTTHPELFDAQSYLALHDGQTLCRDLCNMAPNDCIPTTFYDTAQDLATRYPNINATALNETQMRALGMGAYVAVGCGSERESIMTIVEYRGAEYTQKPVVLVGKGVTFDTGGISLKGAYGMENMRYDMCGAAVVLGVMETIAALQLPINVVGVAAGVENMPDGKAYRPGDILTSMSGQTIEVISTDAEGRLVLCDALTYIGRYNPEYVIDIATLTGAAITSLGSVATFAVGNHPPLLNALEQAGLATDDKLWPMPLWPEYHRAIDSPFADMQNSGQNSPGAITAGCFLAKFTDAYRWVHLDIAGTAFTYGKGNSATGRTVPMLVEFLRVLTQKKRNKKDKKQS
jgi:leucyl aminopeptidase